MASIPERDNKTRILLFDVDGTLTIPRNQIKEEMHRFIRELRPRSYIGIVGGSDFNKIKEQIGDELLSEWDYVFSENGLMAYKNGELIAQQSLKTFLTEEQIKKFINFCLHYIADLDIPIKRGTFIEFRNGMINVSPIGRNCSQEERVEFEKYDQLHNIRSTMVSRLQQEFGDYGLTYSIGGQISFDVFPHGWDKTFCLQYIKCDGFTEIHFFGDKCSKGGNDYEIYSSDDTIGHVVTSYLDTMKQVEEVLNEKKAQ